MGVALEGEGSGGVPDEPACKEVASDTPYVPQPLPGDPVYERARAAAPYLLKHLETWPLVKPPCLMPQNRPRRMLLSVSLRVAGKRPCG